MQQLSKKVTLLDPAQLDHIEGRLTALSSKMNQLAEQTNVAKDDSEQGKKVKLGKDTLEKCCQQNPVDIHSLLLDHI